jgi:hypothetical protein
MGVLNKLLGYDSKAHPVVLWKLSLIKATLCIDAWRTAAGLYPACVDPVALNRAATTVFVPEHETDARAVVRHTIVVRRPEVFVAGETL